MTVPGMHQHLVDWVVQNDGYLHPDVEVAHDTERGYHVRVKYDRGIAAMTRIASCPMTCTLSILNAMDVAPFECRGTRFPKAFILSQPHTIVQHFFLMEQSLLGAKSWWAPYIASLPTLQEVEQFHFTKDEDCKFIEGTNLRAAFVEQTEKWQGFFNTGLQQLQKLKWAPAMQGKYTWELYRWAATIFGSRSFTSQVLADTTAADRARPLGKYDGHHEQLITLFSDGFPVLLPLLDLLNYRPKSRVEWQARHSFVGLQVLDRFESGQELCNNYGPRDNEALLLAYGFTIEGNPFDHFSVALRAPPGSPLEEVNSWTADQRSDPESKCYVFNTNYPRVLTATCLEFALFSFDLIDGISILEGNDRELQNMSMTKKTLIKTGLKGQFSDFRNVLATVSQIMQECTVRLEQLTATNPNGSPLSQKQRYAQIYRRSQSSILQTAIALCRYVLTRARRGEADSYASALSADRQSRVVDSTPAAQHLGLPDLLAKYPLISRQRELLTVRDVFEMLRPDIAKPLEKCCEALEKVVTEFSMPSKFGMAKAHHALVLGALQTQSVRGDRLSHRLQSWLNQLREWYPPEDPNWSYVPDEGPKTPDEAPPPMLMLCLKTLEQVSRQLDSTTGGSVDYKHWLKPKVFCWGWNVMEEEGVKIPSEVEEDSMEVEKVFFVIYCPNA